MLRRGQQQQQQQRYVSKHVYWGRIRAQNMSRMLSLLLPLVIMERPILHVPGPQDMQPLISGKLKYQ